MDDFYDALGLLVAIGAVLIIGYNLIVYYAEHQPLYDPLADGEEEQQAIAAEHCVSLERKRAEAEALAETLRVNKLS